MSKRFCYRSVGERTTVTKIERGNLISKRTMVPDFGDASNARNRTVSFFRSFWFFFLVKSPYAFFQYFSFTLSSNVTFQKFDVL